MSYRIEAEESVLEGVRRAVDEQIQKAVAELQGKGTDDRHERVHQARKRFKKVRGAVRLVRPAFDAYKEENVFFRDLGRRFSELRDAEALIETLDEQLAEPFADLLDDAAVGGVREALVARRDRLADEEHDLDRRLADAVDELETRRRRLAEWELDESGWAAVAGGLAKTYGRGRDAMAEALGEPRVEHFHEWRKRVKYHWYHCRLLRPIWRPPMEGRIDETKALSDHLGDDHDLAVFRDVILEDPGAYGEHEVIHGLLGLVERRSEELREKARIVGRKLFCETPGALVERFGTYYEAMKEGVARPAVPAPALVRGGA